MIGGALMLSLTIHVRQDLGEWSLHATLVRHAGNGFQPEISETAWQMPLTEQEWDSDDLSAVLSAVARWSGMTIEGQRL